MPAWAQYLVALVVLAVVAILAAMAGRRYGRRVRGGIAMAGILLGLGEAVDPPSKHLIEMGGGPEERESPAPGDPPNTP